METNTNISFTKPNFFNKDYYFSIPAKTDKAGETAVSKKSAKQINSDVLQFSKNLSETINGKNIILKKIQSEDEFESILSELLQDSTYVWHSVSEANKYEQAILPYAGRGDIHLDINSYLRDGVLGEKTYSGITPEKIEKYIKVLDYGLNQLDREYGKYKGVVYRCGMFSSQTPNYVSASDKMSGAIDFADPSNPVKDQFNVIFTNHGHKINEMQKHLGFKFAQTESEILLDPGKSFVEVDADLPFINNLKENFYKEFKTKYPNFDLNNINLKFWQEI